MLKRIVSGGSNVEVSIFLFVLEERNRYSAALFATTNAESDCDSDYEVSLDTIFPDTDLVLGVILEKKFPVGFCENWKDVFYRG